MAKKARSKGSASKRKKQPAKKGESKKRKPRVKVLKDFLFSTWVIVILLWMGLILLGRNMLDMSSADKGGKVVKARKNQVIASVRKTLPSPGVVQHSLRSDKSNGDILKPRSEKTVKKDAKSAKEAGTKPLMPEKDNSYVKQCGRVSLIIDDMGRDIKMAKRFLSLPYPIAFAVLPYEPHTAEVASMIKERGRVLLLHMPMEPKGYPKVNPGPGALFLNQLEDEQKRLFLEALRRVPGAVGVNNHMGSRFTEDREAMTHFLTWVKEQGLFFVDSMTTPKSVGCEIAKEIGVPCVKRDVFLDHLVKKEFIYHQIEELKIKAHNRCYVVAIGHPHELTLNALMKMSILENDSVVFVSLLRKGARAW